MEKMKRKKFKFIWILTFVLLLPMFRINVKAAEKDKRVLFISSFSYSAEAVQKQIKGIEKGLEGNVALECFFMDTKNVYDETSVRLFYDRLKYGLSNGEKYDAVILGDDPALSFGMEHKEELFQGIPLLFLGAKDKSLIEKASEDVSVTGLTENLFLKQNIDLGLKLMPKAKKVSIILDDSVTGRIERERFEECVENYPKLAFEVINVSELGFDELQEALRNVDKNSILIYGTFTEDAEGNKYSDKEAISVVTENCQVPVMCMVDCGIGDGLLGGYVVSMEETGRRVALMTMAIMDGRDPNAITVIMENCNIYMVDQAVMDHYDLDVDLIPGDAVIVNRTPSYFERNREVLLPGSILCLAMVIAIVLFCIDNVKRKKLLLELEENRVILQSASQHDFLTKLPNRSKFMEDFQKIVEDKCPCTIMMIDIDDFKSINDNFGHTAGDEALQQLAKRLKDLQTQILTAYRFAGDEFILILKSNQSKIVDRTVFQCREIFSKNFTVCGRSMKICGSIGAASYPKDADDPDQLVNFADEAMYQVKKNGKNDVAFYHKKENAT